MNESNNPGEAADRRHPRLGRKGRFAVLAAVLLGLGATAGVVVGASGPDGWRHGGHGWHHGSGFHKTGFLGGGRHGHHGGPERALDRLAWVLGVVDATDEQQASVRAIAESALADLSPLMDTHRESRREFITAITSTEIDRDALEALRAREVALVDEGSARMIDAIAEIADVLTPEQRAELAGHALRFRH